MSDKSKLPIHRVDGLNDELNVVLNYNNITNCITEIPQDIKLVLNSDHTLTLKAGSKLYIPNGFETDGTTRKFDTITVDIDISLNADVSFTNMFIFYIDNRLERIKMQQVYSGTTAPTGDSYMFWYDTILNKIKRTNDSGTTWTENTTSFPLGLVTSVDSSFTSIDQVFNGFGFIGSTAFALPGVKGLIPNGRNENGTLNNIVFNINNVSLKIFNNEISKELIIFENGTLGGWGADYIESNIQPIYSGVPIIWFDTNNNKIYNNTNGYWQLQTFSSFGKLYVQGDDWRVSYIKPKLPIRVPDVQEVVSKQEYLTENEIQRQIFNRIYDGRDLTQIFADEIANYSDEWAWIKARIQSANYEGLYVGDYIPVTMNAGTVGGQSITQQIFQCQIAGIDTYTGCGEVEIGHHIDFISREVINTKIKWNPTDNNNGTSVQANPWLASNAYAWLNGVNNYTTSAFNNVAHGGNYANAGILQLLPTKLTNLIITKRNVLDSRYDSTKLLTYSTGWKWGDMGKLWLPNELEAYGFQVRSNMGYAQGYWNPEANIGVSYPIYTNSGRNRIKRTSSGGRSAWWLSSAASHNSTNVCYCNIFGYAGSHLATYSGIRCPLCFRIA